MTQARLDATAPQVGETAAVTVERLNDDGDGVAKLRGWTVFVPGALPGEKVSVEIVKVHRRHAEAKVAEWLDVAAVGPTVASDRGDRGAMMVPRIQPRCGVFAACGGCQLQHIDYDAQLAHKREVVRGAMRRVGKFADDEVEVRPTIGMENPWRYRNQVQVPLQWDEKSGELIPGFFASGSHRIVPVDDCALIPEALERTLLEAPRKLSRSLGRDADVVHHLVLRQSFTTGEQMVVVCVREVIDGLHEACLDLLGDGTVSDGTVSDPIVSVAYTVQPRPTGHVWGQEVVHVAGKSDIEETLDGVRFLVSPRSFFQVNTQQARVLVQLVNQLADIQPGESMLDLYCGTGTFSLTVGRRAASTLGVDSVHPAIEDARRNAAFNGIECAKFEAGKSEDLLPKMVRRGGRADVAVLDPPRAGCAPEVLNAIVEAKIPRVVYVSCNPSTLARDLRLLADAGYEFGSLQPVDMFPQTSHVECVLATHYVGKK